MAKRKRPPAYLIMVSGVRGIEIFSAHHTEAEAAAMHDRLGAMLAKSAGSSVHLVEVPSTVGLVAADKAACRKIEPKAAEIPVAKPAPLPPRPQTDAEFDEQTRQMLKGSGPRDGFRDDNYTGAYS